MLSKKYIRILLGALCVFLLLSLVSNFMVSVEKREMDRNTEGFKAAEGAGGNDEIEVEVDENTENDKFNEILDKFLQKVNTQAAIKQQTGVNEADAVIADKVLKRKVMTFLKNI